MKIIEKSELRQMMDGKRDFLLVDVLPEESYQERHIADAVNIPFTDDGSFAQKVEQRVQSKDQRIVVYCASTQCDLSKKAAQALEDAGFTNVQAYEEGLEGWFGAQQAA